MNVMRTARTHARTHLQRLSVTQMIMSGLMSAALFLLMSHAKPLDTLAPGRPPPSICCTYMVVSILGQFLVHMSVLISAMTLTRPHVVQVDICVYICIYYIVLVIIWICSAVSVLKIHVNSFHLIFDWYRLHWLWSWQLLLVDQLTFLALKCFNLLIFLAIWGMFNLQALRLHLWLYFFKYLVDLLHGRKGWTH